MPNTYKITRLQPRVKTLEVNGEPKVVVTELVVGITAEAEDGYADYVDGTVATPLDPLEFIEFDSLDEAWALGVAEPFIEEQGWHESLDRMIEAKRVRALPKPFSWQVPAEEPSE
jgi:hypothetical protein